MGAERYTVSELIDQRRVGEQMDVSCDRFENKEVEVYGIARGVIVVPSRQLMLPNIEDIKIGPDDMITYALLEGLKEKGRYIPIYAHGFKRGGVASLFRASSETNTEIRIIGRYTGTRGNGSSEPIFVDAIDFWNIHRRRECDQKKSFKT